MSDELETTAEAVEATTEEVAVEEEGAKEGDIITCPRCHVKLKLSKTKDGKWLATQQ